MMTVNSDRGQIVINCIELQLSDCSIKNNKETLRRQPALLLYHYFNSQLTELVNENKRTARRTDKRDNVT